MRVGQQKEPSVAELVVAIVVAAAEAVSREEPAVVARPLPSRSCSGLADPTATAVAVAETAALTLAVPIVTDSGIAAAKSVFVAVAVAAVAGPCSKRH